MTRCRGAVTTHAVNFPTADHLIADVSNYDMRRLLRTDMLWVSPEYTHARVWTKRTRITQCVHNV